MLSRHAVCKYFWHIFWYSRIFESSIWLGSRKEKSSVYNGRKASFWWIFVRQWQFLDSQWLFLPLIGSELCSIKKFSVETFMEAHFGAIHRPWEADNTPITVLKTPIFSGQFHPYFQDSYSEFLHAGTKLAKFFAGFRILTISSRTKIVAKMSRFWDPQPKTAKSRRNQKIPLSGKNLAIILHFLCL